MEVIGKSMPAGVTKAHFAHGRLNSLPVAGAKYVQMPRENYEILLAKLHDQDSKLKASLNLHMLLMDRENDNQRLQERNILLEKSTAASELRLGNLIRLHVEKSQQLKSMSGLEPKPKVTDYGRSIPKVQHDNQSVLANTIESGGSSKSQKLASYGTKTLQETEISVDKETTEPGPQEGSISGISSVTQGRPRGLSVPGISRALFDKVVFDNLKLKQLLDETLRTTGRDLDDQLDAQEYEDIIQQLRVDLANAKDQIRNLTAALHATQSGDDSNLRQNYAELISLAGRLEKNLQAKQTLINSYNKEYEKIKIENHELKKRLMTQTVIAHTQGGDSPSQIPAKLDQKKNSNDKSTETETRTDEKPSITHDDSSDKKTIQNLNAQVERLKGLLQNLQQQFTAQVHQNTSQMEQKITRLNEEIMQTREKANRDESDWQKENDSLLKKVQQVETKNSQLVKEMANTDLLQFQLNTYEEDFKNEKVESLKTREVLEKKLSDYQQTIRKLSEEKQAMIEKYQEVKKENDQYAVDLRQRIQTPWNVTQLSCAQTMMREQQSPWFHTDLHPEVTMDNVPSEREELSLPTHTERSPQTPETLPQGMLLVCERCEREFPPHERAKYDDHISKCTDD